MNIEKFHLMNIYSQHYEKMIYGLSETLGKRLSDSCKDKGVLKKLFPVSKSVSL